MSVVDDTAGAGADAPPAWGPAARGVAATLLDIGHTRLQLATTELEEQRLLIAAQAVALLGTLFAFALGIVLACVAAVLVVPPEQRPLVLAALAVLCLAGGAFGVWRWQRLAAARPPLLQATLAELQKDSAALLGGPAR